jgi:hypothetical protein
MIVIGPPMRCREDADREPVYEDPRDAIYRLLRCC